MKVKLKAVLSVTLSVVLACGMAACGQPLATTAPDAGAAKTTQKVERSDSTGSAAATTAMSLAATSVAATSASATSMAPSVSTDPNLPDVWTVEGILAHLKLGDLVLLKDIVWLYLQSGEEVATINIAWKQDSDERRAELQTVFEKMGYEKAESSTDDYTYFTKQREGKDSYLKASVKKVTPDAGGQVVWSLELQVPTPASIAVPATEQPVIGDLPPGWKLMNLGYSAGELPDMGLVGAMQFSFAGTDDASRKALIESIAKKLGAYTVTPGEDAVRYEGGQKSDGLNYIIYLSKNFTPVDLFHVSLWKKLG